MAELIRNIKGQGEGQGQGKELHGPAGTLVPTSRGDGRASGQRLNQSTGQLRESPLWAVAEASSRNLLTGKAGGG